MARVTKGEISEFWYGFSTTALYIRLELSTVWRELLHTQQGRISLRINQGETELAVELAGGEDPAKPPLWSMALDQIVEIRLDLAVAGLKRDALAYLAVELNATEGPTARFPETGMIPIHIIAETYADEHWSV